MLHPNPWAPLESSLLNPTALSPFISITYVYLWLSSESYRILLVPNKMLCVMLSVPWNTMQDIQCDTQYNIWQWDMTGDMPQNNETQQETLRCDTRYFLVHMWYMTVRQHVIPVFNCRAPLQIVCHVALLCHIEYHIAMWCVISYVASSAMHHATRFHRKLSCRIVHYHRNNKVQWWIEGTEILRCQWPTYGRVYIWI